MGKHAAPVGRQRPGEVTLERAAAVLEGLGFHPLVRPDRLVIGAHAFTVALWIDYARPMALVIDTAERIPTDFEHSAALARFINTWNHDRVGPWASFRLMESGDLCARMRRGVHIKHGLSDDQLAAELADTLEHAAAFYRQLRERFLDASLDQPLPPQLMRAQDTEVLLGRHPSLRHLPRGGRREVATAPELFKDVDGPAGEIAPANISDLTAALDELEFRYGVGEDGVIATGVNGVAFALTIDGEPGPRYARVTGMWDTGRDALDAFLPLWLVCNDVNERTCATAAYLHEFDGAAHMHAESTMLVAEGAAPEQVGEFVVSAMAACLAAIDHVSQQTAGHSVVDWPGRR